MGASLATEIQAGAAGRATSGMRVPAAGVAVFALAFAVFAVRALISPVDLTAIPVEPAAVGEALAARGAFADPFSTLPTGETAHVAPGFPFLYAAIRRTFASGESASLALELAACAAMALQLALLSLVAIELGWPQRIGIAAAVIGVALPVPVSYLSDASYTGLLLMLLFLMLARGETASPMPAGKCVAIGAISGLLLLFNPATLVVIAPWIFLAKLAPPRRGLVAKTVIAAVALLAIAPWIARNAAVVGSWGFVRDNLGLELEADNNDCADYGLRVNEGNGCFAQHHPNASFQEAQEIRRLGEPAYYRQKLHRALNWIVDHPSRFLVLTAKRCAAFWFPPSYDAESPWYQWILTLATLVSFSSLLYLMQTVGRAKRLFTPIFIVFPLVYYVVQYENRYRIERKGPSLP